MNKFSVSALFCCLLSASQLAAQPAEITPEMMQQMAVMQNCLAQIDYQEMQQMEQRSEVLHSEITALCSEGKEAAAKNLAITFSKEVMASKTMQSMQRCAAMMPGMAEQMQVPDFEKELEQQSICDFINQ